MRCPVSCTSGMALITRYGRLNSTTLVGKYLYDEYKLSYHARLFYFLNTYIVIELRNRWTPIISLLYGKVTENGLSYPYHQIARSGSVWNEPDLDDCEWYPMCYTFVNMIREKYGPAKPLKERDQNLGTFCWQQCPTAPHSEHMMSLWLME